MNQEQLLAEMERIRLDLVDPAKHADCRTNALLASHHIEMAVCNLRCNAPDKALLDLTGAEDCLTCTEAEEVLDGVLDEVYHRAMGKLYAK